MIRSIRPCRCHEFVLFGSSRTRSTLQGKDLTGSPLGRDLHKEGQGQRSAQGSIAVNRSILTTLVFGFATLAALSLPASAQETPAPVTDPVAELDGAIADLQAARTRAMREGETREANKLGERIEMMQTERNSMLRDQTVTALERKRADAAQRGATSELNELNRTLAEVNAGNGAAASGSGSDSGSANNNTSNQPRYNPYDPYGQNRSRVGEKIIEGLFGIGGAFLQSWLNGGQSDSERAAMDRIFAGNDAAVAGADPSNPGTPIYGPNGEIIGYDRTGNGEVDAKDSDGDGAVDTFTGGSYEDDYTDYSDPSEFAYDDYTNVDTSDAFIPDAVGNVGGGGASAGDSGGASLGGDSGGGDEAAEDEEGEGEDEEGEGEDGEDADDADEDLADADSDSDSSGRSSLDSDSEAPEAKEYVGRIFVLPKDMITAAAEGGVGAVGNQQPAEGDGFADDGWNDSDNGDWADEEDDWGWEEEEWGDEKKPAADPTAPAEPGVPAMGAPLTPEEELLKQEIIQVEAEIAKWQKAEREKRLQQEDPYAFETTRALQSEAEDPLKAYRNEDGKLDLTRVNVWIVVDDSWKQAEPAEGEGMGMAEPGAEAADYSPVRMRLIVPDELLDRFEPIPGGWVTLRGTPVEAEFNPAIFPGLKGSVQDLDLVQVLAVTKEQPANLDDTEYSDY